MPPPDKDYSKAITFSPDVPSLCDDGWLLIGSMSAKPMKGSDVKSDALYYKSLGNSKNIAWGEEKESCELAEYLSKDGTVINLNFESWKPTPQQCRNKQELSKAIAEKADQYFQEMTSPSYIDYKIPKTEEDAVRIIYSTFDLERYKPTYVQGVSPKDMTTLAMVAKEHPGVDVRITEFITPSTAIGVMQSRTAFGLSQDIADASRKDDQLASAAGLEAAGPSNTQPEKTLKGNELVMRPREPDEQRGPEP